MRRTVTTPFCCLLAALLLGTLLTACDKLDDGDDAAVNAVLIGAWNFSYEFQSDADPDVALEYEQVIFRSDGTCAITFVDSYDPVLDADGNETGEYTPVYDALTGTFRASNAVIRIDGMDVGGNERIMLWVVQSFSEKRVVAHYDFELDGQPIRAIVTLERA